MYRLLSLLIVLLFIAPALLARGAQMRQSVRGSSVGAVGSVGAIRWGVRVEWRIGL